MDYDGTSSPNIRVANPPVTKVEVTCSKSEIREDEQITLYASVSPSDATDKRVTWDRVMNQGASVTFLEETDTSLVVKGVHKGFSTIRATSVANPEVFGDFKIYVKEYHVTSISLVLSKPELYDDGDTLYAELVYTPSDAVRYYDIDWSTYGNGNANLGIPPGKVELVSPDNNGCTVKGVAAGKCTISAEYSTGISTSKKITVLKKNPEKIESLVVSCDRTTIQVGEVTSVDTTILPSTVLNKQIVWSASSNFTYVSRSSSQYTKSIMLTGRQVGSEVITATSEADPSKSDSIVINVTPYIPPPSDPVSRIEVTGPDKIVVGTEAEFRALALPETAANRGVSNWWIESGSDKISLTGPTASSTGGYCTIKGLKPGSVTIHAGDPNGVFGTKTFEVVAKPKPTVVGPTTVHLSELKTETYWEYDASGFSNPNAIQWSSSDPSNIDVIQSSGTHAKFESMYNREFTADIIATSGSESARLTVNNIKTVVQLLYWGSGKATVYAGEADMVSMFRMDPTDPHPSQTNFTDIRGAEHCTVEFNAVGETTGAVVFKIRGVTPGTDTITVSNGLVSGTFEVTVLEMPNIDTILIRGNSVIASVEPSDPSAIYTASTSPDANVPVYWDVIGKENIRDGIGGSPLVRRNSCEFRPQLKDGFQQGYFDIIAYFKKPYENPYRTGRITVVRAVVQKVEITGPDELENDVQETYDAKITTQIGSGHELPKTWTIEGDAKITHDGNNFVYVKADLGDKTEGTATLKLVVGEFTATKVIKILPRIIDIVFKGVCFLDKGDSGRIDAIVGPSNALEMPLNWKILSGAEFVEFTYDPEVPARHSLIVTGIAPGVVKFEASNVSGSTKRTYEMEVRGNVHGSVESPITEVKASLLTYMGDTMYVKINSKFYFEFQITDFVKCFADDVSAGFGLRIVPGVSVEGVITRPGTIEIRSQYDLEGSYPSTHKTTIYAIAPSSSNELKITGPTQIYVGQRVKWTAEISPSNPQYPKAIFSVESDSVRIVEQAYNVAEDRSYCIIEGLKKGLAHIIVHSEDMSLEATRGIEVRGSVPIPPPAQSEENICCIDIFRQGTLPVRLMMPYVQSITETDTASLTEISTMVFGYRNRFVMDLGTTKSYTVSFARVNPSPYEDDSPDPNLWSNGKWYEYLIALLDFWQNFGLTANSDYTAYERTGGFKFHFVPSSISKDMYPEIHETVFLIGSISPNITVGKLSFRMTLQVARMTGNSTNTPTVPLTFKSNSKFFTEEFVTQVPVKIPIPINMPPQSWVDGSSGAGFMYWVASDGTIYKPGAFKAWSEKDVLLAHWKSPLGFKVFSTAGTYVYKVENPDIRELEIFIVGAGGGSGAGGSQKASLDSPYLYEAGGAGAGGQFLKNIAIGVEMNATFTITVGKGGAGGKINSSHKNGYKGGDSKIEAEPAVLDKPIVAYGGDGGQGHNLGQSVIQGGKNYFPGGNSSGGIDDGMPGLLDEYGGVAGKRYISQNISSSGGSGGGCCNLLIQRMTLDDGTETPLIRAIGGDGGYYTSEDSDIPAGSGKYGGGAGSNPGKDGTNGADGVVVIIAH